MHEYGHSVQERLFGLSYWTTIAIPSILYNKFGEYQKYCENQPKIADLMYYSMPWERTADWLGGVSRSVHTQADIDLGWWYLNFLITFPFSILIYS